MLLKCSAFCRSKNSIFFPEIVFHPKTVFHVLAAARDVRVLVERFLSGTGDVMDWDLDTTPGGDMS